MARRKPSFADREHASLALWDEEKQQDYQAEEGLACPASAHAAGISCLG